MSSPISVPVLGVLAGGASRRYPGGKLAATLGEGSLLEFTLARLGPVASRRVLAGRPPTGPPLPPDLEVLPDPPGAAGPLAGLLALARNSPSGFVVTPADMPFLAPRRLVELWGAAQGHLGARLEGPDPLPCALLPGAYPTLEELATGAEPAGVHRLLARLAATPPGLAELPRPPDAELMDVDTPQAMRIARERLRGGDSGAVGGPEEPGASAPSGPLLRWDS